MKSHREHRSPDRSAGENLSYVQGEQFALTHPLPPGERPEECLSKEIILKRPREKR